MKEWKKPAGLRSTLKLLISEECFKRFGGKRVLQFCNVEISKVFESSSRKKMKKCVWWIYLRKVYLFILYLKIVVYTCIFEWYEFQSVFSYHYPVFSAKILVCLDVFSRNGSQSIRLFSSKRFKIIIRNMLWKSRNFREYSSLHILFKDQVYILYSQIDSSPEFLSRFFLEHHFLQ